MSAQATAKESEPHVDLPVGEGPAPAPAFAASVYLGWGLPLFVAVLVLLGVCARLRQYTANASYGYDESYLLLNIFDKHWLDLLGPLRHDQAGPPVYFWSLRALYLAAGPAEWVMRAPAFFASLLALALMVPVARRLLTGSAWLWAVALCATSKQAANWGAAVKPYSWDFSMTLLIVLAAHACLCSSTRRSRLWAYAGLCGLAMFAPWCSLPSVFVLGGASLALAYTAARSGPPFRWRAWVGFNLLALLSAASLYHFVLRQQRTPALVAYWKNFYGNSSSPAGLLSWMVDCLVKVSDYGSNGLGIPLMLFAVAGGVVLWRRSPARLLLLAGPLALGMVASLLRCYPLRDRLAFFLVPCLYLLAAEAMGTLAEAAHAARSRRWLGWVCLGGLTVLLFPGAGQTAEMAVLAPAPGLREAFDYAHRYSDPGDIYWVSHPQVFEVYFRRRAACLGTCDPMDEVVKRAGGHRLWLISAGRSPEQLEQRLREAGFVLLNAHRARRHCVLLYARPGEGRSPF